MLGILADNNVIGQVAYLVRLMQTGGWADLRNGLGLALVRFDDVGLTATSTDVEIWQRCQADDLIFFESDGDIRTNLFFFLDAGQAVERQRSKRVAALRLKAALYSGPGTYVPG